MLDVFILYPGILKWVNVLITLQQVYYPSCHLNEVYQAAGGGRLLSLRIIIRSISELSSVELLKKFKGMLKSTFNFYNHVILNLVNQCLRNAAISEADDNISKLKIICSKYNVLIHTEKDKQFDLDKIV